MWGKNFGEVGYRVNTATPRQVKSDEAGLIDKCVLKEWNKISQSRR
jgi:hypothetical protein